MLLKPDPATAVEDRFRARKTLILFCNIHDPITGEMYSRDPRNIVRKAEAHLASTGIADTVFMGPEAEFFIFDQVKFNSGGNGSFYEVDSVEGSWNTGRDEEGGNLGYKPRTKGGYFPVPPMDHFTDLRSEMVHNLEAFGIATQLHHHEVGSGGQGEIGIEFDTMSKIADKLMNFKYVVKNTAWAAGKSVTFMPKPIFGDNGSGMHTHQSLWKDGEPLFYDETGYGELSDTARWYIGGLLSATPRRSSRSRTRPPTRTGAWCPATRPRSTSCTPLATARPRCRIPISGSNPKAKRIEFRVPDPSSNPYLAFAAMMMAGLDGIKNRIEPPDPVDKDIYDLPPEELHNLPSRPAVARGGPAGPARGPRVPARGRGLHRGPDRDLDRVQDGRTRWPPSRFVPTRTSSRCTTTSELRVGYDI